MEKRTAMWTSSWTGEGIHSRGATGEIRVYELPLLGNDTFCHVILITHFFLPKLTTILNFFAKMLLSFYCVVTCGDAKVKELNMLLLALLRPHQFRNLLFFKRSKWNKSCRYWKKNIIEQNLVTPWLVVLPKSPKTICIFYSCIFYFFKQSIPDQGYWVTWVARRLGIYPGQGRFS